MADDYVIAGIRAWWDGLDPGTQTIFEQLYERSPESVIDVLSNGQLTPEHPTLADLLDDGNAGFGSMFAVASVTANTPVEFGGDPAADTPFTATWVETNPSSADLPAYMDYVRVSDFSDQTVFDCTIDRPALASGESATCTVDVPGLPAGHYNVVVVLNSAGTQPGAGIAGAEGFAGVASGLVAVGGVGDITRPDSPNAADQTGVSDAYERLNTSYNTRGDESLVAAAAAMYAFAAVIDAGGVYEVEPGPGAIDQQAALVRRAQQLDAAAEGGRWVDEAADAWAAEVMTALQALYPCVVDLSLVAERKAQIADELLAVGAGSFGIWS